MRIEENEKEYWVNKNKICRWENKRFVEVWEEVGENS